MFKMAYCTIKYIPIFNFLNFVFLFEMRELKKKGWFTIYNPTKLKSINGLLS